MIDGGDVGHETDFVYNFFTENPNIVQDLAKEFSQNPKTIVSVCASGWPIVFKEAFEKAEVRSFDMNPNQISTFQSKVKDVTGFKPQLCQIGKDNFVDFISEISTKKGVDVLFISNIPDYLKRNELIEFVELMSEVGVKTIIFSALGDRYRNQAVVGNADLLAELLEDEDYKVKRLRNETYEVKQYFVANISDSEEVI